MSLRADDHRARVGHSYPSIGIASTAGVSAGAVANAVWHATGVRIRRFPIRIEELLPEFKAH